MPDATSTRTFRPALVAPLGEGFVVVDDVQPVALFVDGSGRCSAPVTWRHLPPATEWWWPPRSLFRDGSGVRVQDRPDGPTVRLDRTDEPLDELGRPCGLRGWSVFLEEDLLSGAARPGADGVVRL